jgi:hypothetical protein
LWQIVYVYSRSHRQYQLAGLAFRPMATVGEMSDSHFALGSVRAHRHNETAAVNQTNQQRRFDQTMWVDAGAIA